MRKILWLIPPLLGVVFYAGGSVAAGRRELSSAGAAGHVGDRTGLTGERLAREGASAEEMDQAMSDGVAAEKARIGTCSGEELKEMIPKLLDRMDHSASWETRESWVDFLNDAVTCLGKLERGAALSWLLEHAPGERDYYMRAWAEVDPAGAFEAVAQSDVREPCLNETLEKLLQGFAAQGPDQLREACLRVPWELFLYSPDSNFSLHSNRENDVRPWIDSGVLPEL